MNLFSHTGMARLKRTFVGGMVMLMIAGNGVLMQPKKADAFELVFDKANFAKQAITAAQTLVNTGILKSLDLKEVTLDGIAWSLAKKFLSQMVRSTIDWVNSGFDGKPAFITNYADYFLEAADQVATDFIAGENFDQMCQPLRVPLQVILDLSYRKARNWETESQCTISEAAGNVNNFLAGNFSEGGWSMWFKMMSEPQNNIYGAAALGESRLYNELRAEEENKRTEATANNGFYSMRDCSSGKCIIVTPGNVISEYLNFSLTVGDRTLIEADEINELIGALMAQLGNQAIAGAGGLLGLSYSSDGTSPSYLDQMELEALSSGFGGGSKFLDDAARDEEKYIAIHVKALDDLEKAAGEASCSSGTNVLEDILELAEDYADEVDASGNVLEIIVVLKEAFENASDEGLQRAVVEEFQRLQDDGLLHSTSETTEKTFDIAEKVTALQERAENACN